MSLLSTFLNDLQIRPAAHGDVNNILALLNQFADTYNSAPELQAGWQSLNVDKQTLVAVTAAGQIIGYAELLQRRTDWFKPQIWIQADYQRHGLGLYLSQRLEEQLPALTNEASVTLLAQIVGKPCAADNLLAKAGYALMSTFEIRALSMTEAPQSPSSIPGIEIRPLLMPQEIQAAYEADEEAFFDERGYVPRTFEQWSKRISIYHKDFDPACCFVAWDNGVIAGGIYTGVVEGAGEIAHLGVRRPWRKRGLADALSLHVLRAYYERGIYTIQLNVDAKSLTNAQHLYARLGFLIKDEYRNYTRKLTISSVR